MTDLGWLPRDRALTRHALAKVSSATASSTDRYERRSPAALDGHLVDGLAIPWITIDNPGNALPAGAT